MTLAEFAARWLVKRHTRGQRTFCYCPGCGIELCNTKSWFSDTDLVRYRCIQCGHDSAWLFDAPAPILIKGTIPAEGRAWKSAEGGVPPKAGEP